MNVDFAQLQVTNHSPRPPTRPFFPQSALTLQPLAHALCRARSSRRSSAM
jgi:hypothetical protein